MATTNQPLIMTGSIKETLSDITEDFDLHMSGSRGHELMMHAHGNTTTPRSHNHATATAGAVGFPSSPVRSVNKSSLEEDQPTRTFLSPFSSKACQQQQQQQHSMFLSNDTIGDEQWQLSLHATRAVSVVVFVADPTATTKKTSVPRMPCVFPPFMALEGKLKDSDEDGDNNHRKEKEEDGSTTATGPKHRKSSPRKPPPPSPTTATLNATAQTKDLVIINPTAFGTTLPNQVSLDILNSITRVAHNISSEDWVRLYRFHQVWWPTGRPAGLDRLATAIAHDVTTPASIAQRVVIGKSSSNPALTTTALWGSVVQASVAQAFAQAKTLSRQAILETYGLLGWTLHQLGPRLPAQAQLTLSVLQVVPTATAGRDELQDLLQTKTNGQKKLSLKHQHGPTVVTGLTQVPVDAANLKAVGHLMRRAWMAATHPRKCPDRGHLVVTLRIYCDAQQVCDQNSNTVPSITWVDMAPTSNAVRRDAAVRQTLSVLGGVLRGQLLKAAGNQVAIPYRESVLTQVLHGFLDRSDSRTLLLTGVSALKDDYDYSMADLRYCSRILEKPGEAPKSPFDSLSKAATSPTSQMSHSTTASEQRQRQLMMEQFDPKYHSDLLRNVTADPRQRFSRAGMKPARQRVALASSAQDVEAYIPPDYMDIDPGAVPLRPLYDNDPNNDNQSHEDDRPFTEGLPNLDTTFTLDSSERGDADDEDDDEHNFFEPSPMATYTGSKEFASMGGPLLDEVETARHDGEEKPFEDTTNGEYDDAQKPHEQEPLPPPQVEELSLSAEMDALSLELRRGVAHNRGTSPTDSAMDNLSYELLHRNEPPKQSEAPISLEALEESPIKEIRPSHFQEAKEVDLTSLPPQGSKNSQSKEPDQHSEPGMYLQQRPPIEYFPPQSTAAAQVQRVTQHSFRRTVPYQMPPPPSYDDVPRINSSFSSKPNSEHVDLTLYRMTPRGATGLPSDIVVNHPDRQIPDDQEGVHLDFQSVDSFRRSYQGPHTNEPDTDKHSAKVSKMDRFFGTEDQVDNPRRSYPEPPSQRSFLDPPSQNPYQESQQMDGEDELSDLESQRDPPDEGEKEQSPQRLEEDTPSESFQEIRQEAVSSPGPDEPVAEPEHRETIIKPAYEISRSQQNSIKRDRPESPDFFPSDSSETRAEIGQIDALLNDVRKKTKSRSQSISNDLTLIEQNQRSVVRRLVAERDTARRDLDSRTEEQLNESARREQELRELRRSLESVHAERQELEQIAEEAVTGREGLERRALELERALKKKEKESVSRNEYLLLKDECDDAKRRLEERSEALSKVKSEMVDQTATISNLELTLRDMEQDKLDLQSRLQSEKSVVGRMDERNGKIQSELDSLRSQVIILENERKLLQSQMDSTKRSLQLSLEQKDGFANNLSEQLEQLQIDLHESQTNLWAKEEIISRLQKEQSTNSLKIENLMEKIKGFEEEVEYLKKSKIEVEKELGDRLVDTKKLSEALRHVTQERDVAENKLEEAEILRKKAETKLNQVEQETTKFRYEASRRIEAFLKKHKESEAVIKEQESDMRTLGDEKEELHKELEASREENRRAWATAEELTVKLEEVTRSKTSLAQHEQSELKQLRQSKSDLQSKIEDLNEQLVQSEEHFRLQIETEREERRRAEADRDASQQARHQREERFQIEAEQNARRQMEDELDRVRAEVEENTRHRVEKAQQRAKEEAEDQARRRLEHELERIRAEAADNARRQIEKERERLRHDAERTLQSQIGKETERIRLETEREVQNRLEVEREKLKLEAESNLRWKLREERENIRRDAEGSLHAQFEAERERVLLEADEYYKKQFTAEREKFRLEAERAVQNQIREEREKLRLEAEEDIRRQVQEERKRLQAEADRQARQQVETRFERLRSESELDLQRQLEDASDRLRIEAEEAAKVQLEAQLEKVRTQAYEDLHSQLEVERKNLRIEAERELKRQVELQMDKLRSEAQRDVGRQLDDERERLRIEIEEDAQRQADIRIETIRVEAERDARRQLEAERNRLRIEAEDAARRETEEERERLRIEAERYARRLAEEERERARVEFDRRGRRQTEEFEDTRHRLEDERDRQRIEAEREARRLIKEERERRRAESEREARIRAEEERANRRWGASERAARADVGERLRLDSEAANGRVRSRRPAYDDRLGYRTYSDYDTPRVPSDRLDAAAGGGVRERAIHGQDDYRRLEEVTVALAQALHGQSRTDEDDIAHLLRQFHAAEDAITAHNRYFRTRIEGLRHTASKR
eukprot:scaffold6899_cov183-Amphora_coffeaeformis.AAC.15